MSTEILIHAHAAAQAIFDRHAPLWKAHGLPVTVMCPVDAPVYIPLGFTKAVFGSAAPAGPKAYERHIKTLYWMRGRDADDFLILEYDAFCLSKSIIAGEGLTGNLHPAHGKQWVAQTYAGYPMCIDRKSVNRLLGAAERHPEITEGGYVDRLYSALADLSGVPIHSWIPPGFCMNTIQDEDIPALQQCIRAGGRMIHGVKTQRVLDACLEAMK